VVHDVDHGEIRRELGIFWTEYDEIADRFDFSIRVSRGKIEIDDLPVLRIPWIECEVDAARDSFVDARVAECAADVSAGEDLDPHDPGVRGGCDQRDAKEGNEQKTGGFHRGKFDTDRHAVNCELQLYYAAARFPLNATGCSLQTSGRYAWRDDTGS